MGRIAIVLQPLSQQEQEKLVKNELSKGLLKDIKMLRVDLQYFNAFLNSLGGVPRLHEFLFIAIRKCYKQDVADRLSVWKEISESY